MLVPLSMVVLMVSAYIAYRQHPNAIEGFSNSRHPQPGPSNQGPARIDLRMVVVRTHMLSYPI
jgi:hypothetical protein